MHIPPLHMEKSILVSDFASVPSGPCWQIVRALQRAARDHLPFSGALCPARLWAALWTQVSVEVLLGPGSKHSGKVAETRDSPSARKRAYVSQEPSEGSVGTSTSAVGRAV